jgi:hypothetical protein
MFFWVKRAERREIRIGELRKNGEERPGNMYCFVLV